MKKCCACGQVKEEKYSSPQSNYCRGCLAEMHKLGLKATEYRKYLAKQPKIENTCGGTKPGERKWSIENTATGCHWLGDDKQEFLSVLKNQLAGE